MIILPAVDIKGGKCVRLTRGDYNKETVYFDDPVAAARLWISQGAEWLHIVDLDGALEGKRVNSPIVEKIISGSKARVEIGGGIRDEAGVEAYLRMGAARVVIGTRALEDQNQIERWCQEYPGQIAVSLDVKNGKVAIKGWTKTTGQSASDVAKSLERHGVSCLIYTDTSRDGAMIGIDAKSVTDFISGTKLPVIIAGGVTSLDDIKTCKAAGAHGVILGKALYEGKINLKEAITQTAP